MKLMTVEDLVTKSNYKMSNIIVIAIFNVFKHFI